LKIQNITMNNLNKFLLVFLVLLIATIIKVYPAYQYSFEPSGYLGQGGERITYFLKTGHILQPGRGEVILDILGYAKSLIIPEMTPQFNLLLFAFFLSLVFSLVVLLFTRICAKNNYRFSFAIVLLIVLFSISATPDIIERLANWNGPYAWIFLFLFIYFIVFKKKNPFNTGLGLFFLFLLPLTYFTDSLYLFVILSIALLYQIFLKKNIFPVSMIILYGVFFLSWLIYMSIAGLNTILSSLSMLHSFLSGESRILMLKYVAATGSTQSIIKNSLCIILACSPIIFFVFGGYKEIFDKYRHFFMILIISLFFLAGGSFLWMGYVGVIQRIPLLAVLFSILLLAIFLSKKQIKIISRRNIKYSIMVFAVIGAIIISSYTYLTSEYNSTPISFGEAEGSSWLRSNMDPQKVIFTDFRLSAPFEYRGFSTIILNDVGLSAEKINWLLEDIYYNNNDPMNALLSVTTIDGRIFDYLFFSQRCTEKFPGLKGYEFNFLPPPKDFLEKYQNSNKFNYIYENNEVNIFLKH
jgi:hypothetical protein